MAYSNPRDIPVEWGWHYIMDAELKQALADMETRISRHVDERFDTFSHHVDERLESFSRHVDDRLESFSHHFEERLENTETKLLTAFHNWAQTYEVRARGTVTVVREFEERLGFVEERLNKLERARNGQTNPGGPKS
jgi:membrane-bound lytic murein transglycosylase MltF